MSKSQKQAKGGKSTGQKAEGKATGRQKKKTQAKGEPRLIGKRKQLCEMLGEFDDGLVEVLHKSMPGIVEKYQEREARKRESVREYEEYVNREVIERKRYQDKDGAVLYPIVIGRMKTIFARLEIVEQIFCHIASMEESCGYSLDEIAEIANQGYNYFRETTSLLQELVGQE